MSQIDVEPDHGTTTGTPPWVKVFGIIAIILVLLFSILHLTGNSLGGPGSHSLHSGVIEQGAKHP